MLLVIVISFAGARIIDIRGLVCEFCDFPHNRTGVARTCCFPYLPGFFWSSRYGMFAYNVLFHIPVLACEFLRFYVKLMGFSFVCVVFTIVRNAFDRRDSLSIFECRHVQISSLSAIYHMCERTMHACSFLIPWCSMCDGYAHLEWTFKISIWVGL